jgi:hypothetical protein
MTDVKTVRILIDTRNDAFSESLEYEVARILKGIAARLIDESVPYEEGQKISDINGNTVGYLTISTEL